MRAFAVASISIGLLLVSCGPTGPQADEVALAPSMPPQARVAVDGTAAGCAQTVRSRVAFPVDGVGATMRELAAGNPVLLVRDDSTKGSWPWRCSIVFGYGPGQIYLQGPVGEHHAMTIGKFGRLWHEANVSGFVMLPPGTMPASAQRDVYLRSVAALTRNGMAWESVMAFDAALATWPDSGEALVGLGDALVALGDIEGAARAYQDAARVRAPAPNLAGVADIPDKKTVGEQNR
jgi:hypothetical protein